MRFERWLGVDRSWFLPNYAYSRVSSISANLVLTSRPQILLESTISRRIIVLHRFPLSRPWIFKVRVTSCLAKIEKESMSSVTRAATGSLPATPTSASPLCAQVFSTARKTQLLRISMFQINLDAPQNPTNPIRTAPSRLCSPDQPFPKATSPLTIIS